MRHLTSDGVCNPICPVCGREAGRLVPVLERRAREALARVAEYVEANWLEVLAGINCHYQLWYELDVDGQTRAVHEARGEMVPPDKLHTGRLTPQQLEFFRRKESVQAWLAGVLEPLIAPGGWTWPVPPELHDTWGRGRIRVTALVGGANVYQLLGPNDECFHYLELPHIGALDEWIREANGGEPDMLTSAVEEYWAARDVDAALGDQTFPDPGDPDTHDQT